MAQRGNIGGALLVLGVLATAACGSNHVGLDQGSEPDAGVGGSGSGSDAGVAGSGASAGLGGGLGIVFPETDVTLRRLTRYEYAYTIRDLFGGLLPADIQLSDAEYAGFSNYAEAQRVTEGDYEALFRSAQEVVNAVFADPMAKDSILRCVPGDAASTCTRQLVEQLGLYVWRRPLGEQEITRSLELYQDALTLGESPEGAVKHLLRGWLSSLQFIYRMEFDPEPDTTAQVAVSPYELASRLSYLLWSSTPDATLLASAGDDSLLGRDELQAQVDRLLQDPRSYTLAQHFAGSWLNIDRVATRVFEPTLFPEWNPDLAAVVQTEAYAYFDEFLHGGVPFSEFVTHDVNYVNAPLATLYGMDATGLGNFPERRVDTSDGRVGFLGLSAFLASTSPQNRTSPTLRGEHILTDLLCVTVPPPPNVIPPLVDESDTGEVLSIRAYYEAHIWSQPSCGACHTVFDPYGFALENFDAIGRQRTTYPDGELIDPVVTLTGGIVVNGLQELAKVLSADPRLTQCAAHKLFIYALGRGPSEQDQAYLQQLYSAWQADSDRSIAGLIAQLVQSDAFRYRHASMDRDAL